MIEENYWLEPADMIVTLREKYYHTYYSLEQLSYQLGYKMNHSTFSRIVNGSRKPSFETYQKIYNLYQYVVITSPKQIMKT
jgi:hypothetical protein